MNPVAADHGQQCLCAIEDERAVGNHRHARRARDRGARAARLGSMLFSNAVLPHHRLNLSEDVALGKTEVRRFRNVRPYTLEQLGNFPQRQLR